MEVVDTTQIYSFAPIAAQTDFPVSPSEEAVFITAGQLQEIISQAVEKALQPLQDVVRDLKATVTRQDEKIATLESTQETQADNQLIQLRLIGQLREAIKIEPQPLQKDRADILRALVIANNGKMLLCSARQKMHLRKDQFSQMLKSCDFVEVKPLYSDKRKMVIILKDKLV
jgi:hypothetical protein